jgi:membrane protease YdiL (CAAX protease family)
MVVAYFSVSLGLLAAHYLGGLPAQLTGYQVPSVEGVALAKFGETIPIVLAILLVHFLRGGRADELFLKPTWSKLGIGAGIVGVTIFLVIAGVQAIGLDISWGTLLRAAPWILIFTLSNAFLEELWFRALFLKKLEPFAGRTASILLTSFVFAVVHISSTYVIDILLFVLLTFLLGLLWAWLMGKTKSIWASVFIHASGDVLVIVGLLAGASL